MFNILVKTSLLLLFLIQGTSCFALEHLLSSKDKDNIINQLSKINFNADNVITSPIPGIFQATSGVEVLYITKDGRHIFHGDILDIQKDKKNWNLTENFKKGIRKDLFANIKAKDTVAFKPKPNMQRAVVYVFTDIDCGFCRRFHQEIADITAKGIEVRYLGFPRAGVDSKSFNKLVSVWCNSNQRQAMTDAKAGLVIEEQSCNNPISNHYAFGVKIGISGTPSLIFENGYMYPGYLPPADLAKMAIENRAS